VFVLVYEHILQAEDFIQNLPEPNREFVENYIERFTDWLAEEEPYLYQQGFFQMGAFRPHFKYA